MASVLTYYSLLSVVPVLALFLELTQLFGVNLPIQKTLLTRFPEQKEALVQMFTMAENLMAEFHGPLVTGVGTVVFFWSVGWLLVNLETGLNHIWKVEGRKVGKAFKDLFSLMILAPLFFFIASSTGFFIESYLGFSLFFLPWILFSLLFAFVYWAIPNAKLQVRSAVVGGVVAAALYLTVQWGYVYFQIKASNYGTVYGQLAALPLLLVWVQVSWYVFLFGAEVSHAYEQRERCIH